MPAVNINNVHGLGMFNNQVNTALDGDSFSKRIFNLFVDAKILKYRLTRVVFFYNFHFVGCK
jgi:hypothetical protein